MSVAKSDNGKITFELVLISNWGGFVFADLATLVFILILDYILTLTYYVFFVFFFHIHLFNLI